MTEEFREYTIFKVTAQDGTEVELAVVDEFEFEHKSYVAAARVEGDTINEDGIYIYKAAVEDGELITTKITNKVDYERIANAYLALSEAAASEDNKDE